MKSDTDNSIDSAIDGVTLNLKQAEVGEVATLTVATDNAGIASRVNNFVSGYNVLATQIAKLRSYDADTKVVGPLLGDAMLRNIEDQIRRQISAPVAGATGPYTSLATLGITTTGTGTLTLDQTKFNAAMAADPGAVSRVFSADQGIAVKLDTYLTDKLSGTGELSARDASLKARSVDLDKQKAAVDTRMEVIQARYQKQFNALDTLLNQMQSTSSYLTKQLAAAASTQNS
jgi:flagellar hook-associated protein 2